MWFYHLVFIRLSYFDGTSLTFIKHDLWDRLCSHSSYAVIRKGGCCNKVVAVIKLAAAIKVVDAGKMVGAPRERRLPRENLL